MHLEEPKQLNWRAGIERARELLGLSEWRCWGVKYNENLDADTLAQVTATAARHAFIVQVSPQADQEAAKDQGEIAIHEMVHLFLDPLDTIMGALVNEFGTRDKGIGALHVVFHGELEKVTDRLAHLLTDHIGIQVLEALNTPIQETPHVGS